MQVRFIILQYNAKRKTGYNVQIHIVPFYYDTNLAHHFSEIEILDLIETPPRGRTGKIYELYQSSKLGLHSL